MSTGIISSHTIWTRSGATSLLEWVKDHKYRNYASFNADTQLSYAKQIAALEDKVARDLSLKLLSDASMLQEYCEEMHREFETLLSALIKINESNAQT